ncbi:MAG TPA: iron uptake transporter permease EfeU [Candidatus Limnocylindria bacterium]|nr:iron uptake transporter permease EfeU [Candidatus Limnocylindria bacterium]
MDFGFLTTGLLTGLREGVEAALIVSIILAYLAKTGNQRHFGKIWFGAGAAVALSVVVGLVLFNTIGGFEEPAEQIFEGFAMLIAAGVVTWMLFWMRRTSANIKGELQAGVDRALLEGGIFGLGILAFTAVIREGIETALFLMGQATAAGTEASSTLVGAIIGLVIAVVIGYALYKGARVINLRTFFSWTGIALVFIAAGLLSHGIHEFIEAGWISFGTATAFDISAILPHEPDAGALGVVGSILRALVGYTSTPEWITFIAWLAYVVVVLYLYTRPIRPSESRSLPKEQPAPTA